MSQFELLGTTVDNNLDWGNHINEIIKRCFATAVATLKTIFTISCQKTVNWVICRNKVRLM